MIDVAKILEEGAARRTRLAERRKVIESFRRTTQRSTAAAVSNFLLAIACGGFAVWSFLARSNPDKADICFLLFMGGNAIYLLVLGLKSIWISPRDKILLLMIDELLEEKEPNQALLPTPTSVTDRAAHAPRQP